MLTEIAVVKQPPTGRRRWFADDGHDLIVWYDAAGVIAGFQFCYRSGRFDRALTWDREGGFAMNDVDDGEGEAGRSKMSPILVPDGVVSKSEIAVRFEAVCGNIDRSVAAFVAEIFSAYPNG